MLAFLCVPHSYADLHTLNRCYNLLTEIKLVFQEIPDLTPQPPKPSPLLLSSIISMASAARRPESTAPRHVSEDDMHVIFLLDFTRDPPEREDTVVLRSFLAGIPESHERDYIELVDEIEHVARRVEQDDEDAASSMTRVRGMLRRVLLRKNMSLLAVRRHN